MQKLPEASAWPQCGGGRDGLSAWGFWGGPVPGCLSANQPSHSTERGLC